MWQGKGFINHTGLAEVRRGLFGFGWVRQGKDFNNLHAVRNGVARQAEVGCGQVRI